MNTLYLSRHYWVRVSLCALSLLREICHTSLSFGRNKVVPPGTILLGDTQHINTHTKNPHMQQILYVSVSAYVYLG